MEIDDLERMKFILDIWHALREMAPEDIEKWRSVCIDMMPSEIARDFINLAADIALKPDCMKK